MALLARQSSVQAIATSFIPTCLPCWCNEVRSVQPVEQMPISGRFADIWAVGVGQDEEPSAPMRSACLSSREESRPDSEAHRGEVGSYAVETEADVPLDVLEEDAPGAGLADDAPDMRPEMAGIILAEPVAGRAEGLAGIPRQNDIHRPTPWPAVKGANVIPDRRVA